MFSSCRPAFSCLNMSSQNSLQAGFGLQQAATCIRFSRALLIPLYIVMVAAIYGAFLYAPTEQIMQEVQRIFYFHVSAAMISFVAFAVVFVGGIAYLATRNRFWDTMAASAVEVGVFLTVIVLTTGPIWSRPAWNVGDYFLWLKWDDPRVLTEMILFMMFVAYLILRSALPEGHRKSAICSVFGIIGFLDVPIVYLSIFLWDTFHPVVITPSEIKLDPRMQHAWLVAILAFLLLTAVLILLRMGTRLQKHVTEELVYAHHGLLESEGK